MGLKININIFFDCHYNCKNSVKNSVQQALVKVLQLVVQDLERERRGKNGVENLARAFQQSPNFSNVDSQQNVSEKLHHVSMTNHGVVCMLKIRRYCNN